MLCLKVDPLVVNVAAVCYVFIAHDVHICRLSDRGVLHIFTLDILCSEFGGYICKNFKNLEKLYLYSICQPLANVVYAGRFKIPFLYRKLHSV